VQRRVRKRAPHTIEGRAGDAAPEWVSSEYDANKLCVSLERAPSGEVPDQFVSLVPAGRMRAAVAGLLRDTFRRTE